MRNAPVSTNPATTKHPILKRLQSTNDLEVYTPKVIVTADLNVYTPKVIVTANFT